MRAHRVDLRDDPDADAGLGGGESRALAGEAGADHEDVMARHAAAILLNGPASKSDF
jgi:hypothetical protein